MVAWEPDRPIAREWAVLRNKPRRVMASGGAGARQESLDGMRMRHGKLSLAPEEDRSGNVEYKLQILPLCAERFERLVTQMQWRIMEGGGACVYKIGVEDDGRLAGISQADMRQSLGNLCGMGATIGAHGELTRLVRIAEGGAECATTTAEAVKLLALDEGLPDAVVGKPAKGLAIGLVEWEEHGPTGELGWSSPPPTVRGRGRTGNVASRRERRLAQFEEAVHAGRGWEGDEVKDLGYADATKEDVRIRGERLVAEVVMRVNDGAFVDFTALS